MSLCVSLWFFKEIFASLRLTVVLYFLSKTKRPILNDLVVKFSQEKHLQLHVCLLPDCDWFSVASFQVPKWCTWTKKSECQSWCELGVCRYSNNCSLRTQTNATAELFHPSVLLACTWTKWGTCIGRKRRECLKQCRIFDNTVLAATVYDCFTLNSFDPSFHGPSAFCIVRTENDVVILGCKYRELKKMWIQPYLLCGAVSSMHEMEKRKQLCNISRVSFRGYNLSLKFSCLVKMLLS